MKKIILGLMCLLSQNIFSQDSIYKKNNEIIVSKIEEIDLSQIKYRKLDNLTGPLYLIPKSDVFKIRYVNGLIDTIAKNPEVKGEVIVKSSEPAKTSASKQSIMYKKINDRELFVLINAFPVSARSNEMQREYDKMIKYKQVQYLSNGVGYGIGFAVPVVVTFGALANSETSSGDTVVTAILVGAFVGAAIRITGQVFTIMYKHKRAHAKENVMLLYDQLN
jgi:hypothetical protein